MDNAIFQRSHDCIENILLFSSLYIYIYIYVSDIWYFFYSNRNTLFNIFLFFLNSIIILVHSFIFHIHHPNYSISKIEYDSLIRRLYEVSAGRWDIYVVEHRLTKAGSVEQIVKIYILRVIR